MAYKSFKKYIQENYNYVLQDAIQGYINKCYDGLGYHSLNVISLLRQWPDNVQVMTLTCHDDIGPRLTMDVHVCADIVSSGLGTVNYEADRKKRWFTIYLKGMLKDGLQNVEIIDVDEYQGNTYDPSNGLDEYLVPYIKSEQLEDIADDFTELWCDDEAYANGTALQTMLEAQDLICYEADLPAGEIARMYFREDDVSVYDSSQDYFDSTPEEKTIRPGTMLIDRDCFFMSSYGSIADSIAHEMVHWDRHGKFFEILAILDNNEKTLYCNAEPTGSPDGLTGVAKARWWAEWQANSLAPRIILPRRIFNTFFPDKLEEQRSLPHKTEGEVMERALHQLADKFNISVYEAKLRALQLGYKQAEGVCLRVKGSKRPPYSFNPEALDDRQTFILDNKNGARLYREDHKFAELIRTKRFLYTGHVVVINHPLYVKKTSDSSYPQGYELTDFALEHIDLCCLKFSRNYTRDDCAFEYYDQCYLSKDVDAPAFKEARDIDYSINKDVLAEAEGLEGYDDEGERLAGILAVLPSSFWGTFDAHMNRLKSERKLTNEELHFRTGYSERHIRALRKDDENVSRNTVYALCIGMHLHPYLSDDLVKKGAGGYPPTKEGMYARTLIERHYMEPLSYINKKLKARGYKPWGNENEIQDVGTDAIDEWE